jgi:hypothetical protein
MDVAARLKASRAEVLRLAAQNGASNVRIFGSVARGEAKSDSDIDFLVHLEQGRSLMDLSRFWLELEDLLGCKVDVVSDDSLHWYIRDRVLNEAVPL